MSAVLSPEAIQKTIAENNYIPGNANNHMTTETFWELYGPEALKKFAKGKELLMFLFGRKEQNELSLAYSMEHKSELHNYFGKAAVNNDTNKVLNCNKEHRWRKYRTFISESEAIDIADNIRNSLVAVVEQIEDQTNAADVLALLRKENLPDSQNWLKKYLTILYPDKFMLMLIPDWTNRIFVRLGLTTSDNWYENAKMFSEKAGEYGLDGVSFYHAVCKLALDQTKAELEELGIDPQLFGRTENFLVATKEAFEKYVKSKLPSEEARTQVEEYLSQKFNWNNEKSAKSDTPSEQGQKSVQVATYSKIVMASKNTIFRGAPGTGKSYLAKAIAADIVSNGTKAKYSELSEEEKQQVAFVQFHPSYDYSDFVEGLRPVVAEDGKMGFELRPGIFKSFVEKARENVENSKKSQVEIAKERSIEERLNDFLGQYQETVEPLETMRGNKFTIKFSDAKNVYICVPGNEKTDELKVSLREIKSLLASEQQFDTVKDVRLFFGKNHNTQQHSYVLSIYKAVSETTPIAAREPTQKEPLKKYVFIIDEINRGEISKILGELFFSIDPSYRGKDGAVLTQYHNMHDEDEGEFYIPDNVYIIGTMNDIDRSVDTFDFAMRRRFRFVEIDANTHVNMLEQLGDKKEEAVRRMKALNKVIEEKLNKNYQIGAAYFLKLKSMDYDQLWSDHLEPLLQEYVNGAYDEADQMKCFRRAYEMKNEAGEHSDENA